MVLFWIVLSLATFKNNIIHNIKSSITATIKPPNIKGRYNCIIAKALLSISDENMQFELAERVIEEDFSVRETEKIVKSLQQKQNTEMIEQKPQNTIVSKYASIFISKL